MSKYLRKNSTDRIIGPMQTVRTAPSFSGTLSPHVSSGRQASVPAPTWLHLEKIGQTLQLNPCCAPLSMSFDLQMRLPHSPYLPRIDRLSHTPLSAAGLDTKASPWAKPPKPPKTHVRFLLKPCHQTKSSSLFPTRQPAKCIHPAKETHKLTAFRSGHLHEISEPDRFGRPAGIGLHAPLQVVTPPWSKPVACTCRPQETRRTDHRKEHTFSIGNECHPVTKRACMPLITICRCFGIQVNSGFPIPTPRGSASLQ